MKPNIDLAGEWELTPEELASIFRQKRWVWDEGTGLAVFPSPQQIRQILNGLAADLAEEGRHGAEAIQQSRFLVFKDRELPNSYSVYLLVGFAWDQNALTAEEREALWKQAYGDDEEDE